jgi:arylsulfatase A-like enzyme
MPLKLIACVAALAVSAAAWSSPSSQASRLNVLFLMADDLNNDLGVYGAPVRSPNIDKLAARGVRFDRVYEQYPLCSPSRSSLLTGRRPNATGVLTNPGKNPMSPHFREKLPDAITLPQLFRTSGWFAARVGKLYHYGVPNTIGTGGLDDYLSWDLAINPRGRDRESHDRIFSLRPGQFGGTLSWLADDGPDAEHTDGIGAAEAVVDLYPTLAELAGLQPKGPLDGVSLVPMLRDLSATVKDAAFTQVRNGYSVRTDRWRYTEWADGEQGTQLYDMDKDPGETTNLAQDGRQATTVAELKARLAAYRR